AGSRARPAHHRRANFRPLRQHHGGASNVYRGSAAHKITRTSNSISRWQIQPTALDLSQLRVIEVRSKRSIAAPIAIIPCTSALLSTRTTRALQRTSSGARPVGAVGSVKNISTLSPTFRFCFVLNPMPRSDRFTISPSCGRGMVVKNFALACAGEFAALAAPTIAYCSAMTLNLTGIAYDFRGAIRRSWLDMDSSSGVFDSDFFEVTSGRGN